MHNGRNDVTVFEFLFLVQVEDNQVLDFQVANNVVRLVSVNGYFRKVSFLQNLKHISVNNSLFIQDNRILKANHVILDNFGPQIHCVLQNLNFLRPVPILSAVV